MDNILTAISNISLSVTQLYTLASNEQDRDTQKLLYSEIDRLNSIISRLNKMPITTGQTIASTDSTFSAGLFGSKS